MHCRSVVFSAVQIWDEDVVSVKVLVLNKLSMQQQNGKHTCSVNVILIFESHYVEAAKLLSNYW